MPPLTKPRIALVLGGGGLKGFAHLGVVRALRERGIEPALYAGTSIGALIAGAICCGTSIEQLETRATSLRRGDLFRINRIKILVDRLRAPAVYSDEPLRSVIEELIPLRRFTEVSAPLLVNSVDIESGQQVVWGLPGLRDVEVRDAVYASCALPGAFPPGMVGGQVCVDGGAIDNLPAGIAGYGMDGIVAVDVGSTDIGREDGIAHKGFFDISMRAAQVTMSALQRQQLGQWTRPPMLLIRPRVNHVGWFEFGHAPFLIEEGYRATKAALEHLPTALTSPGGIYPRRAMAVDVIRERCTGCALCTVLAPGLFAMDQDGKAFARERILHWSPAEGAFVRQCPTNAIAVTPLEARLAPADLLIPDEPSP